MFPADGPNLFEPILQKIFFAIIDGQVRCSSTPFSYVYNA